MTLVDDTSAFSTYPVICQLYLLHSKSYWMSGMLIHQKNTYLHAASSAPVAMKRWAVKLVSKVKALPEGFLIKNHQATLISFS
jgi:hypothetical protein